jgi:hypothetical protein
MLMMSVAICCVLHKWLQCPSGWLVWLKQSAGGMWNEWVGRLACCALYRVRELLPDSPARFVRSLDYSLQLCACLGLFKLPQLTVRGTFVVHRV